MKSNFKRWMSLKGRNLNKLEQQKKWEEKVMARKSNGRQQECNKSEGSHGGQRGQEKGEEKERQGTGGSVAWEPKPGNTV